MHPKNKHKSRYDLGALSIANPSLKAFVKPNAYNDLSIDFANPKAVKALNKALLAHYYQIPLFYIILISIADYPTGSWADSLPNPALPLGFFPNYS